MINNIDKEYFLKAVGTAERKDISDSDISVKCPVCGDSKYHKNVKRLHLYEKRGNTLVHCFNGDCPVGQRTVFTFLRDFYPTLLDSYRHEKFREKLANGELLNNIQPESTEVVDVFKTDVFKTDPITNKKTYTAPILTQDLTQYFQDIKGTKSEAYLLTRGFTLNDLESVKMFHANIDLTIGDKKYPLRDYIVIPMYYNGVMYGFYSRSTQDKRFYTYNNDYNLGYKLWNYFDIDRDQDCYIFEGIFDALSMYKDYKNVIACMGAKIPQERIDELKSPVFFLDNDKTGLLNSLEYAKKGYKVVVLPPDIKYKDANEMMLNGINILNLAKNNTYSGIMAIIKIRERLS